MRTVHLYARQRVLPAIVLLSIHSPAFVPLRHTRSLPGRIYNTVMYRLK